MKKKFINSLKFGSLLGFACNNIKADYSLTLMEEINSNASGIVGIGLNGNNDEIIDKPTSAANFNTIGLPGGWSEEKKNEWKKVEENFTPVYYYVKGDTDPKICSFDIAPGEEPVLHFDCDVNNVKEVVWVKKSDKKNKVSHCFDDGIKEDIENKEFLVDEKFIYNFLISKTIFKTNEDIKKHYDINITLDKDGNKNIEIIMNFIFKIDAEKFKISSKCVKDNDFITPLNNLENLYIKTDNILKLFDNNTLIIKDDAIKYIFTYKSNKYYIISDAKLKEEKLFEFLKTKNNLKDKDLTFDSTTPFNKDLADDTVVPGEYKFIDKVMPKKPEEPENNFKYKFTGDKSLSNCIGKDFVTKQKVKVQTLFINQDTSKYVFVAIKDGTSERFINDQELESGTYELKREEKPKNEEDKNKVQGSGQNSETAKKGCNCC